MEITGKTIYVLGAGASQHTNAPLLCNFLVAARHLLEKNSNLKFNTSFRKIFEWIDRLRGSSYYVEFDLENLEHIFSLCEMSNQIGNEEGKDLSLQLKYLVLETLDRKCQLEWRNGQFLPDATYRTFTDNLSQINEARRVLLGASASEFEKDLLITFNYDVMLDYAMYFQNMEPEYCLFPPPYVNHKFRLLKLHGSINWAMCSKCGPNQSSPSVQVVRPTPLAPHTMVAPSSRDGALFPMRMMTEVLPAHQCGFCQTKGTLEPFIIPPTWSKAVGNSPVAPVWAAAVSEIKTAFQIIIIGYSMPPTDTFFQYLLTLGLSQNPRLHRVIVVDKDSSEALKNRYKSVFARGLIERGKLQFMTGIQFSQFVGSQMTRVGTEVG